MDSDTRKHVQKEISKKVQKRKARDSQIFRNLKEHKSPKKDKFPLPRRTLKVPDSQVPQEFKNRVLKLVKEADDFAREQAFLEQRDWFS